MRTKVQRWGNSLAVRIPKPFAMETKLSDQADVDLTVANGKIILAPMTKPTMRLKDLLARVTKRNLHSEVNTGAPRGREAW